MIDSHCHLTYTPLASQLEGVLERAAAAGVKRMVTIGTSVADAAKAIELCRGHANIRCAIGIHPHHSAEATAEDLAALPELARQPEVLALGEMGLDYHYDFSPRPRQREIFLHQLELAVRRQRPVVFHCREAIDDCLGILRDYPSLRGVFHCFTGSSAEARRILDAGHLIGLTGVVTFKKSEELREIVRFIPADRLLLETDAPYLAPEPLRRQKVNEPSLLVHTARVIAKLKGVALGELDRQTTEATEGFFGWE